MNLFELLIYIDGNESKYCILGIKFEVEIFGVPK